MSRRILPREEWAAALITEARTWLGTPFHHQGRTPGRAADCAAIVVCPAQAVGIKAQDVPVYSHQPGGLLRQMIERQMLAVPRDDIRPGDVLLMKYDLPQHLALVTGIAPLRILHAHAHARKTVEHEVDTHMAQRIVRVYRYRELAC